MRFLETAAPCIVLVCARPSPFDLEAGTSPTLMEIRYGLKVLLGSENCLIHFQADLDVFLRTEKPGPLREAGLAVVLGLWGDDA